MALENFAARALDEVYLNWYEQQQQADWLKTVPRVGMCYKVDVNQGARDAEVLAVMADPALRAYQALLEYDMPAGTTGLYLDTVGPVEKSDLKFIKRGPRSGTGIGYNQLPIAWLQLMVDEDSRWSGHPQKGHYSWAGQPQPAEMLASKKSVKKAGN